MTFQGPMISSLWNNTVSIRSCFCSSGFLQDRFFFCGLKTVSKCIAVCEGCRSLAVVSMLPDCRRCGCFLVSCLEGQQRAPGRAWALSWWSSSASARGGARAGAQLSVTPTRRTAGCGFPSASDSEQDFSQPGRLAVCRPLSDMRCQLSVFTHCDSVWILPLCWVYFLSHAVFNL